MRVSISITTKKVETNYIGWRGLHTLEGGRGAPLGMPEILNNNNHVKVFMTKDIQWMCYDLAKFFAPNLTPKKFEAIYGNETAMNNGTGFGGETPVANYISKTNLNYGLPAFDKQRTFAGSFIKGEVMGNELVCKPGIHALNSNGFIYNRGSEDPNLLFENLSQEAQNILNEIMEKNWYCKACTNAGMNGAYNFPHLLPYTVVYPFIVSRDSYWPIEWFSKWEENYLPNYLEIYE